MAIKVDGAKKAKKVVRDPLFLDEKYTGTEPVWDAERAAKFSDAEFDSQFRVAMRYYNYFYGVKDLKKYLVAWATDSKKFNKDDISKLTKATPDIIPLTACAITKAATQGMPLRERFVTYLTNTVKTVIATSVEEVVVEATAKPVGKKVTIQDRLAEKLAEVIGELEGHFDEVLTKATKFKSYDFLEANKVPQAQLGKIEKIFAARADEIALAQSKEDEQLTEAYSHWKLADFKRVNAWLDELTAGIAQYRGVKQATKKARVRKPPAKEKQVAKLKYLKSDATLKLVSVNPVDIIGAKELFVYDTKTRKLFQYIAEATAGQLGVKGSAIIGYDEHKSVGKTLRKPAEQLAAFAKAGKVQLRTFMANIKAVEVKASGRINANQVLLKVL